MRARGAASVLLGLALALAGRAAAAPLSRQGEPQVQTVPVEPGTVLRITNPRGAIRIEGWSRPQVEIRARRSGRSGEPVAEVSRSAGRIEIRPAGSAAGVALELRVPATMALERVASTSNSLSVSGMRSDATLATSSGSIRLDSVDGNVRATSSSGAIEAADVSGNVTLTSTTGRVAVERARGVLVARSVSSSVTVRGADAVTASSTSASVSITGARGKVTATSTSGSVRLEDITSADVEGRAVSSSVSYSGSIERGGRYELESFSGSVEISLPAANCGFTLVAKTFSGAIDTDFEIQLKQLDGRINTRRIEGVHGGGCARIAATSFSGSMVLRRR
jgi:DUF4097 and DUF4098 domain-containing protein YvlB